MRMIKLTHAPDGEPLLLHVRNIECVEGKTTRAGVRYSVVIWRPTGGGGHYSTSVTETTEQIRDLLEGPRDDQVKEDR